MSLLVSMASHVAYHHPSRPPSMHVQTIAASAQFVRKSVLVKVYKGDEDAAELIEMATEPIREIKANELTPAMSLELNDAATQRSMIQGQMDKRKMRRVIRQYAERFYPGHEEDTEQIVAEAGREELKRMMRKKGGLEASAIDAGRRIKFAPPPVHQPTRYEGDI